MSKRSKRGLAIENIDVDPDIVERKFREKSPCRRTCSTTHHPMHHCSAGRFNIKIKRGRPCSASEMTQE